MRRLRRLTIGAAALGAMGTVALSGAAAISYSGHATATAEAVAVVGIGSSTTSATNAPAPAAAPTATPAATDQISSSTVVVHTGQAASGLVTSGGS